MLGACTFHSPKLLRLRHVPKFWTETQKKNLPSTKKKYLCLFTHLTQPFGATLCIAFCPAGCVSCPNTYDDDDGELDSGGYGKANVHQAEEKRERKRRATIRMKYAINEPECSPFWVRPHTPPFWALHVVIFHKSLVRWWFFACGLYGHFDDKQRRRRRWRSSAQGKKQNNKKLKV